MSYYRFVRKLLRPVKCLVKREVLGPFRIPYQPPEYEMLWGRNLGTFHRLFAPYRKWRDRNLFQQHLRPSDVFVVGHPKSGNTWVGYMLAVLVGKDQEGKVTLANVGEYAPVVHGRDSSIRNFPNLPNPRVFRNEWTVHADMYPKTIYLLRDPRAVLLSYYHMYQTMFADASMSLKSFTDEYLRHGFIQRWEPLVRWDRQVLTWMRKAQTDRRTILVRYEDLVKDRRGTLLRMMEFAEIPFASAALELAIERGSFEAMKANEEKYGAESYPGELGKRGRFVRRGKVDAWKDEMTEEIKASIEHEFRPVMQITGYL